MSIDETLWNVALTAAEMADLARGRFSLEIRPENVVRYKAKTVNSA